MTEEQRIQYNLRKSIKRRAVTLARRNNIELPPVKMGRPASTLTAEQKRDRKNAAARAKTAANRKPRKVRVAKPKRIVMTLEESKAVRSKRQRDKRQTAKEVRDATPKPAKLRVDKPAKPPIIRLPNRPHDTSKVKVRLDSRTEIYTNPGYCLQSLRAKYGIAV